MSEDELFVLIGAAVFGGWSLLQWYARLHASAMIIQASPWRHALGWAPVAVIVGVFIALRLGASYDVKGAIQYLALYTALGAAWIFLAMGMLANFGISARDDAIERRNRAAAVVVVSAFVAHAAIYAGANIGDGPGWWVVVIAGLLGAGAWFALWFVVEMLCGVEEQITVERDLPAAIRIGGYMIGTGIVFGRAVAGDWVSLPDTIHDMWVAWPVLLMAAGIVAIERGVRTQPAGKDVTAALVVAAAFLAAAIAAVWTSPPLSQNPIYPP